jgi:hypothetical protein
MTVVLITGGILIFDGRQMFEKYFAFIEEISVERMDNIMQIKCFYILR